MGTVIPRSMTEHNLLLKDSRLHMISQREGENEYSIAPSLSTENTMAFLYGYAEMKATIPFDYCVWASFWTKTHDNYRAASYMTEVDIFEGMGKLNNYSSSVHKWVGSESCGDPGPWDDRTYTIKKEDVAKDHTYGFLWTPEEMSFYCDGNKFYTRSTLPENDRGEGEFAGTEGYHDPMFLILTNHLFLRDITWWIPDPVSRHAANPNTVFPKTMKIDYVRLYQKPGEGEVLIPKTNRFP